MIKCFAVSNSFQVDAQGNVKPCCKFKHPIKTISDYSNIDDVFTSLEMQNLKTSHDSGEWTPGCERCSMDETSGIQSRRLMYDRLGLTTETDFFLDVSLGNYCNLKCRMCTPENSTKWITDYKLLLNQGLVNQKKYKNYLLSECDIDKICVFLETITGRVIIEVKGGEPLLMPNSFYFFNKLNECKNKVNFEIWVATNGTKIPKWFPELVKDFKKIELSVSVDGTDEVYEYIRGGNLDSYSKLLSNALSFTNLQNLKLRFNVVVQNLNIKNLPALYYDLYNITKSHNDITLIILRYPEYYQLNIFPDDKKAEVVESLKQGIISENVNINSIIRLFLKENVPSSWEKFLKITAVLDKSRKQDISKII